MKKKQDYSLTSRERKLKRREEEEKKKRADKSVPQSYESDTVAPEGEAVAANPAMSKKQMWIVITCIILALVIILTGVLLLIFVPRRSSRYPRAVIELSNGATLTMTIWEDECPIAASNFIFLAKIGFFDGTLIYDVQQDANYMRLGKYTSYEGGGKIKYNDEKFLNGISTSIFNIRNLDESSTNYNHAKSNLFGYRLKRDLSEDANRYGNKYVVSFNNNDSADFVVNLTDNNTFTYQQSSGFKNNLVAFGEFEDEESQKVLDEIVKAAKNENVGLDGVVGLQEPVYITSIKIRNVTHKKKWKNFEFVSFMLTAYNGETAISSWRN